MYQTPKKAWTSEEDSILLTLVDSNGARDWNTISAQLGTRSAKQCRERYHNHLQPNIKKGGWSDEEDRIIFSMQPQIGNQWAKIAKLLPGRTDNAVKNRWHAVIRSQQLAAINGRPGPLSEPSNFIMPESPISSTPVSCVPSSEDSQPKRRSPPAIPSLRLGGLSLANSPAPASAAPITPMAPPQPVDLMMMFHDHCHNHTEYAHENCESKQDDSIIQQQQQQSEMILTARSETFSEILGNLSASFSVLDGSDMCFLSARSDLIHDEAVSCIMAFNPSISEHCLSARASMEESMTLTIDCEDLELFLSPRLWTEEDGSIVDMSEMSGKQARSRLTAIRSPRSPALFMTKRFRS